MAIRKWLPGTYTREIIDPLGCAHRAGQDGYVGCTSCNPDVLVSLKTWRCERFEAYCLPGTGTPADPSVRRCLDCSSRVLPGPIHPTLKRDCSYEAAYEQRSTEPAVDMPHRQPGHREGWWQWPSVVEAERRLIREVIASHVPRVDGNQPLGIVICGGGKYWPAAFCTINVIRSFGYSMPIELWCLPDECRGNEESHLAWLGVTIRRPIEGDGFRWCPNWWRGWQLKSHAIVHSNFREVVSLDADCYPIEPHSINDLITFGRETSSGSVVFPDIANSAALLPATAYGKFRDGLLRRQFRPDESSVMYFDRLRASKMLQVVLHLNSRADWSYQLVWGDKDLFGIAAALLGIENGRIHREAESIPAVGIYQLGQGGERLFLHACNRKPTIKATQFATGQLSAIGEHDMLPMDAVVRAALKSLNE